MTARKRQARMSCHVKGCKGAANAPRHAMTSTHLAAVRAISNRLETNGPAVNSRPTILRDPHGQHRDWDAEARAFAQAAHEEYEAELRALIEYGPLPEAPTVEYPNSMALIPLKEAAKRLGLKPVTLRMAIHRGRMTGHKMGRDWLVEESEVAWYEMRSLGRVGWPKGRPRKTTRAA